MSPGLTGATKKTRRDTGCVLAAPLLLRQQEHECSGMWAALANWAFAEPWHHHGGIAQLVERQLCKLEVTGSSPVASTNATGRVAQLVRARP